MRHSDTTSSKRSWALRALPVAVFLALVLPVSAGAGVKYEAGDTAVRIPSAIFGAEQTASSSARVSFDKDEGDKDKGKDKDDKCKEKKDDCDAPVEPQAPSEPPPPPSDDVPEASWAG